VQIETPEEVVRRIARARDEADGGAIAFDGDGTLWNGDVGDDFFRGFIASKRGRTTALHPLRALALAFGIESHGEVESLAHRLFEAYRAGRVSEERICEMVAYCCAGWTRDEVTTLARDVVARSALLARVQSESAHVLAWAKTSGVEVFLVSASPCPVVEEAGRVLGIDEAHVVAATPIYEGEVMCAAVDAPIPYGEGKVTRLRERLGERPLYAAFGDNVFDIPLLRAARVAVAVRPKVRLLGKAHEVDGLVELAQG
jgi:HAD superfamily phosphoserine phosphatase-like hydrolase